MLIMLLINYLCGNGSIVVTGSTDGIGKAFAFKVILYFINVYPAVELIIEKYSIN